MMDKKVYVHRRAKLMEDMADGVILLLGNAEMPMNYKANTFRFRQDSSFLYFGGPDLPGLSLLIDVDNNKTLLFGNDYALDEIIWMGEQVPLAKQAVEKGIDEVQTAGRLADYLGKCIEQKRRVHYLPPYHASHIIYLTELIKRDRDAILSGSSDRLTRAVIKQRSVKDHDEIAELEKAVDIAREMHTAAMRMAREGLYERDIAGAIEGIALAKGEGVPFSVILSVRGEILHNIHHGNKLRNGDLIINDSGAESLLHYASDITRTFPVSGKFASQQKEIYEIVLSAQTGAIEAVSPGKFYKDIHLQCATMITEGLKTIGLMKGDPEAAVEAGAHALFFPHGLGHMLGLDVHDMEGLGENLVGYDQETERSEQFGLASLRLAKKLRPGYVLTVEPGIYFIPALISKWQSEKKFYEYINYELVHKYIGFGGVRIEDDVLITENGGRVLGKPIPKTINEVELACR